MKIWKYAIEDHPKLLNIPKGGKVLAVQSQRNTPCIWVLVDPTAPPEPRYFITYGTGHEISLPIEQLDYIGTWQIDSGLLIFHTFEVIQPLQGAC